MDQQTKNRPLTESELRLARWMLEHGTADAKNYLDQLYGAEVTPWRCKCGCATIHLKIKGHPEAPPGVHVLASFVFGDNDNLNGIMIYSSQGILSSIEVYKYTGKIATALPEVESLRSECGTINFR